MDLAVALHCESKLSHLAQIFSQKYRRHTDEHIIFFEVYCTSSFSIITTYPPIPINICQEFTLPSFSVVYDEAAQMVPMEILKYTDLFYGIIFEVYKLRIALSI